MSNNRINITIPTEIRERMDRIEGKHNWSKVAATAFESYMNNGGHTPEGVAQQLASLEEFERYAAAAEKLADAIQRIRGKSD